MQSDGAARKRVLHIFLQAIAQSLSANCCPGAAQDMEKAALRIGAMTFIHRFGHNLN